MLFDQGISAKQRGAVSLIGILAVVAMVILPFYFCCAEGAQDKIAAIVNNEIITSKELSDYAAFVSMEQKQRVKARDSRRLLDKLIEDRLILQEAKNNGLKADETRVKNRLEEIKKRYPSEAVFQRSLMEQGLAQQDIEEKLREQMLMFEIIDKQVRSKIKVTPQEITAFFEEDKKLFEIAEERSVEYAVTSEEAKVDEVYSAMQNGESLKHSAEKAGVSSGVLQVGRNGKFLKNIEDAVFSLKAGEICAPLKAENEFYVFKLVEIVPPRQQTLSEVSDEIRELIFNREFEEALASWVDKLRLRAYIKVKL